MHPKIAIPQPKSDPAYNEKVLHQYLRAIKDAGGEPVVIDLSWSNAEIARAATQSDGVCLPGSPADVDPEKFGAPRDPKTAAADPARDNADELLLQDAYNMKKPILGICYGVQSLNVWRTGTLVQHIESKFGINHEAGKEVDHAHSITVDSKSSILGRIVAPVCQRMNQEREELWNWRRLESGEMRGWVNSSHHQSVDKVGDGLEVVARADDGVVEAIESTAPDHFILGVQWHPERTSENDELSKAIFRSFVQAAWQRHREPRNDAVDFENVSS